MKKLLTVLLLTALVFCTPASVSAESAPVLWTDSTAEEVMNAVGVRFSVPAEAENVSYRVKESAAEMNFTVHGVEYAARIQPTASFENISDYEFDPWAIEDECMIGWCGAKVMLAQADGKIAALCLWYDAAPGLMYSVSACVDDLIGLDIQAAAESVFAPMQNEADGLTGEMLHEALAACTGYAGTAGSSLKNAIAACRLAVFAAEHQLADMGEKELAAAAADAILLLTDDQKTELSFNIESMNGVLTEAFTDYDSVVGLFEDAGIQEEIELLMAAQQTQEHFAALYEVLLAAGLQAE